MKRLYCAFYEWIMRDIFRTIPRYWFEERRGWIESTRLYWSDIRDALKDSHA